MLCRFAAVSLAAVLLTACTTPPQHPHSAATDGPTITGKVTYRERIRLPPDATLAVHLLDITKADTPVEVIASDAVALDGAAPPYAFRLRYDPARIQARHRYAVQARIQREDTLLMHNRVTIKPPRAGETNPLRIIVSRP